MGHNLNIENGQASMMYVREVPWHGLGTQLKQPPKTAAEAMRAAKLDWEVGLKPIYCMENGIFYEMPEKKAVVRLDKWGQPDCIPFALVGDDYQVLQNRDAFAFFDPIIETGMVTFETAGALGDGRRVWVLGKVGGKEICIRDVDVVKKYLLFSTGHDGRTSLQIRFTPIRVVCQNTLLASLMGKADMFKIYHVPGMRAQISEAQAAVTRIVEEYKQLAETYEAFAVRPLKEAELNSFLRQVFPDPKPRQGQKDNSYNAALAKVDGIRNQAARLFREGMGNDKPPVQGTLWAAYNGVVELVDHFGRYTSPWQRLESIWFGDGKRVKEAAFVEAKKILSTPL